MSIVRTTLVLLLVVALNGCATARSNSRGGDERARVWFKSLEMEKVRKENESALIAAGEFGIKLGAKLIGSLVEAEGKKYTEKSGARTSVHLRKVGGPGSAASSKVLMPTGTIKKGGFFLFGRTVRSSDFDQEGRSKEKHLKGLPRLDDAQRDVLACEVFDALYAVSGEDTKSPAAVGCDASPPSLSGGNELLDDIRTYIDSLRMQEDEKTTKACTRLVKGKPSESNANCSHAVVTSLVLGAIRPTEERKKKDWTDASADAPSQSFELQLFGYYYAATKAKNLSWKLPGASLHKTKSVFAVALAGPQGFPMADGKRFSASGTYAIKWDRSAAKDSEEPEWITLPKESMKHRSGPIKVPVVQDFLLSVSLIESSDMTEALKGAAKEISALEISLGDD